jgi:GTP-binding protein
MTRFAAEMADEGEDEDIEYVDVEDEEFEELDDFEYEED